MSNVVNLAEYRKAKEEAEIQEEIAYLLKVLDDITASLPPMEEYSIFIPVDTVEGAPFILPQTNLDGYYTDEDK